MRKTLTMSKIVDGYVKGMYTRDEVMFFGEYKGYTEIEVNYYMDVDHIYFGDEIVNIMYTSIDLYDCENFDDFYEYAFNKRDEIDPLKLSVNTLSDDAVNQYFSDFGMVNIYNELKEMRIVSKMVKTPREILYTLMQKSIVENGEYLFNITQQYYEHL